MTHPYERIYLNIDLETENQDEFETFSEREPYISVTRQIDPFLLACSEKEIEIPF